MDIPYSAKQLRYFLWTGIAYTLLEVIALMVLEDSNLIFWFLPWGILHLIAYAIQRQIGWLTITPSTIIVKGFLGIGRKELEFSKLTKKKYFAGDYILAQGSKEIGSPVSTSHQKRGRY